jgi:cobalt-zinc-cadmium efflux system membrane fusion protein
MLMSTGLMLAGPTPDASAAEPQAAEAPMLVHQGDRIVVPADSPLRRRLAVAPVAARSDPHDVASPAIVEADPARTVAVLPALTGRLVELRAGLGDSVARGQVLARISSPDLAQAEADVDKAADALDLARRAQQRARGVKEAGANATKDLEAADSAYNQALAEDGRARSRLKTLNGSAAARSPLLSVTAPISGVVIGLNVGSGAFVNDPTAALMTIANVDRVWVTAQVPENLIGSIARGQAVSVRLNAYPDQTLHGSVRFISPVLEPDTRRAKVRIEFANPDGHLKPNMFATATFAVAQSQSVAVPTSALLMNNDSTTVFVEVAPWTFARRAVELGSEDADSVRIVAGLKAGERVVTRGGVLLND